MTHVGRNDGILQGGNGQIINTGAMAFGAKARASSHQAATSEQTVKDLRELRTLLAAHGSDLSEASQSEAEEKLTEVADQLDRAEPDRGRLTAAVSRLTTLLTSVAPLAEGAERLRQAVEKLMH
jgi:uncharacterized protein DUF5955